MFYPISENTVSKLYWDSRNLLKLNNVRNCDLFSMKVLQLYILETLLGVE